MSLGAAYNIPKTERDLATGETRITSDYKKFQILKFASSIGFRPEMKDDKIMLSDGHRAVFIDEKNLPDMKFIIDMRVLRSAYNELRLATLGENVNSKKLSSKPYQPLQSTLPLKREQILDFAYPEHVDPIVYVHDLLQDLNNLGKKSQHDELKEIIKAQFSATTKLVGETSWGNTMAQSLQKFIDNNLYLLEQQDQMGE